jgi:hypothetical protein
MKDIIIPTIPPNAGAINKCVSSSETTVPRRTIAVAQNITLADILITPEIKDTRRTFKYRVETAGFSSLKTS